MPATITKGDLAAGLHLKPGPWLLPKLIAAIAAAFPGRDATGKKRPTSRSSGRAGLPTGLLPSRRLTLGLKRRYLRCCQEKQLQQILGRAARLTTARFAIRFSTTWAVPRSGKSKHPWRICLSLNGSIESRWSGQVAWGVCRIGPVEEGRADSRNHDDGQEPRKAALRQELFTLRAPEEKVKES